MTAAAVTGQQPFAELLNEDDAHLLSSRGVLRIAGRDGKAALHSFVTNRLPDTGRQVAYAAILDSAGNVRTDLFAVTDDDDVLIDCALDDCALVTELFGAAAVGCDATIVDESAHWRVFGLLNNQSVFDDGSSYIRYADPRRHELGSRILRPRDAFESTIWRHEGRWRSHAYRLGVATGSATWARAAVTPCEANLTALRGMIPGRASAIVRRILPFRVEPSSTGIPLMLGQSLTGMSSNGAVAFGTVIAIQGVFGLAVINLPQWRGLLREGARLECADEQILVTWPTWIASESQGICGPAAGGDVAGAAS